MFWLLTRGRWPLLGLLFLITLLMATGLAHLQVEEDTHSMISSKPAQLAAHDRLRELFSHDDIMLLSLTPPQLLTGNGLTILSELTDKVAALNGVNHVISLSNVKQLTRGRYGAEVRPLLPAGRSEAVLATDLLESLQDNDFYTGLLISADRRTAGLIIVPKSSNSPQQVPELIRKLRALMIDYGDRAELHLTGVAVQQMDVAEFIRRDQKIVLPMVVVVLAVMLAVFFRRLNGVFIPLIATVFSLVWTMGLYGLCGYELNTISALLPPVIMILAVSNSVHLYNAWLQLDGSHHQRIELWAEKAGSLILPCSFTALTTSFGLLSLTVSSIPAVRQFGLFAAAGVIFSLLNSLIVVPIFLSFFPLPSRHTRSRTGSLRSLLAVIADLSTKRPALILTLSLVSLLLALPALSRLQNNTNLVGFLREGAPLAVDTAFIDRHLGGVNVLDFMVRRSDGKALDHPADYQALEKFEQQAQEQPAVGNVLSILPVMRQLHRVESGKKSVGLPQYEDDLRYELDLLRLTDNRDQVGQFLTADRTTARISVLLHNVGSREALATVRQLESAGKMIFANKFQMATTGSYFQMILDSDRLVSDMLKSFALSLTLVILSILVLLRSFRLTLLAVIPNVLPIVWTLSLMGYFGIDLSTGTAMIGAVAFGLAVDDTIHYLVHLRRVHVDSVNAAVYMTTTRIGRALMITTLVLTLGFWVGCFGSFKPTIYFSLLVGGTLVGALLCDLLVLPATLVLWPVATQRQINDQVDDIGTAAVFHGSCLGNGTDQRKSQRTDFEKNRGSQRKSAAG